jgi:hypothetical protein
MKEICIVVLFLISTVAVCQTATDKDTAELTRLEAEWNNAHLNSDVAALDQI